ncbi:MAG TPA: hypothetical protein VFR11_09275 [Micromonosporaceae bacterium]|nr:hypothetical protein [Micromonosporaceae bacterium]
MTNIFVDSPASERARRAALYRGDLVIHSPRPSALALAELARDALEEAFAPYDPREAQYHFDVDDYAAILGRVKPAFIHDPRCKSLIASLMAEIGEDPEQTYFDVPRLRSATAKGYLTTGIAYAFHPHRDTWYSAPLAQVNWWFPVYDIEPDNGLAFHPRYFDRPVRNSSATYNYYRWNAQSRGTAASMVGTDTREQPKPLDDVELDPQIRVIAPVGGLLSFAGNQLHSSVPNTSPVTRFSIDFRTVSIADLADRIGAVNVDCACTGTTLRDFVRCTTLERLPDDVIAPYDDDSSKEYTTLVYEPTTD